MSHANLHSAGHIMEEHWSVMQLADLDEAQRSGLKRVDNLERAATSASKTSQQYEAQLQALERQLKEAQAATRVAESDFTKVRSLACMHAWRSVNPHLWVTTLAP